MNKEFPYADPETIEKRRAAEFYNLSWEEKYARLMAMIKLSYELRMSREKSTQNSLK